MANQQYTKKHHYVPECYLKRFMLDEHLYTLDMIKIREGLNEFPKINYPGRICYIDDYYTIKSELYQGSFQLDQYDKLYIENDVLHSLENRYPALFDEVTTKAEISLETATILADFIVNLKLRNPYHLANTLEKNKEEWIDEKIADIVRDKMPDSRFANMPDWIKEYAADLVRNQSKGNPHFSKQMQLFGLIQRFADDRGQNERLRNAMLPWNWVMLIAPEGGPHFITTDNPGFSVDGQNKNHSIKLEGGFAFHMPLSPQHCLLISDFEGPAVNKQSGTKTIHRLLIGSFGVYQVNDRIIQVHNRLLIAARPEYLAQIGQLNKNPTNIRKNTSSK